MHIKSDIHFQSKMLNNILINHFNSKKTFKTVSIYKGRKYLKYIMSILPQRSSGILQSLPQASIQIRNQPPDATSVLLQAEVNVAAGEKVFSSLYRLL